MDYFGVEIGAEAGVLYDNSTNIVQLIRNTYEVCEQQNVSLKHGNS